MAEGQQLRWWQEQEQSQASHQASERVALAATPLLPETLATPAVEPVILTEAHHDTWEELEAEAVRRAAQAKIEETESVAFYLNTTAAMAQYRLETRLLWVLGSFLVATLFVLPLVILLLTPHHRHHFPPFTSFWGLFSMISIFARRAQWLKNQENPILRLSPQGISLSTVYQPNAFIPWDEITSIKIKRVLKRRRLEIRAGKRRRYILEEKYLPLSAEALAARIAVYETGRRAA